MLTCSHRNKLSKPLQHANMSHMSVMDFVAVEHNIHFTTHVYRMLFPSSNHWWKLLLNVATSNRVWWANWASPISSHGWHTRLTSRTRKQLHYYSVAVNFSSHAFNLLVGCLDRLCICLWIAFGLAFIDQICFMLSVWDTSYFMLHTHDEKITFWDDILWGCTVPKIFCQYTSNDCRRLTATPFTAVSSSFPCLY